MKLNHYFTPYTRINARWIKGLNVKNDATTLSEEYRVGCLYILGSADGLSKKSQRT